MAVERICKDLQPLLPRFSISTKKAPLVVFPGLQVGQLDVLINAVHSVESMARGPSGKVSMGIEIRVRFRHFHSLANLKHIVTVGYQGTVTCENLQDRRRVQSFRILLVNMLSMGRALILKP